MMHIGIREIQKQLADAFENGLRLTYGNDRAALYREVALYYPGVGLDTPQLQRNNDLDTAAALSAIVGNRVQPGTLHNIRAAMIGCALLMDKPGTIRWATEGLSRVQHMTEPAARHTLPQWQSVLRDPDEFIRMARQIKFFMNQM